MVCFLICYNSGMNQEGKTPDGEEVQPKPGEYVRTVKTFLRNGKQRDAFRVLQQAVVYFPDDAYLLSYYGLLQALVERKYRIGVETCKKALSLLKGASVSGQDVIFPVLYLNLGRAFIAAGKKKDAIDSFQKGLKFDSRNSDLLKELRALGTRKKPPVSFLDRSNPINIYIGKIMHSLKKEQQGKR